MSTLEYTIAEVFLMAKEMGLRPRKWGEYRLKVYNGFDHDVRVRKWQALHLAIQMGLETPAEIHSCSICDSTSNISYHSEDYSSLTGHHPVCKGCHQRIHNRFKHSHQWLEHVAKHSQRDSWFAKLTCNETEGQRCDIQDPHQEARKMNKLEQLEEYGFPEFRQVTNRWSVAELFKPGQRSGVYVLQFSDGSFYVGISIDFTQRFAQHRGRFDDIEGISFIQYPASEQESFEKRLIHHLEAEGVKLRNRIHMSQPEGDSDLEFVIPVEEQETWLENPFKINDRDKRPVDEAMDLRYRNDYQRFQKLPDVEKYLQFLKSYLDAAIPSWEKTEMSFWSMTCLPNSRYKLSYQQPAIARINMSRQEVLTIGRNLNYSGRVFESFCIFFLAESPFKKSHGSAEAFAEKHSYLYTWDHRYRDGGHDQACFIVDGIDNAKELLADIDMRRALRLFNVRLMRKNPCLWVQNHCLALVEAATK